jgi:hypothetical protein
MPLLVMDEGTPSANGWRYVVAVGACLVLAWFPYVRHTRVPLLGLVDLGFHELGHLVTSWLPAIVTAAMGSGTQLLVPIGLAAYFLLARGDLTGGGLCLAWAATSAYDVSVYVADAPYERLELIGGEHDWAFVLGELDAIESAGTIAAGIKVLGVLLLLGGLACCLVGWLGSRTSGPAPASPRPTLDPFPG